MDYQQQLGDQLWAYRQDRFAQEQYIFDQTERSGNRPPVFVPDHADKNVLVDPSLTPRQVDILQTSLCESERHRWFRSMKSSQAIVQSVFGTLKALQLCDCLRAVSTDNGSRPFKGVSSDGCELRLERRVTWLGERRTTSIDVSVLGEQPVAVECKLTEDGIGECSRPNLDRDKEEFCNGDYEPQHGWLVSCSLTHLKVKYWDFIPQVFKWNSIGPHRPCPLRHTYQLARNVLAACVKPDGSIGDGYAILLYDDRNPAFQPGGPGFDAVHATRAGLLVPQRMQLLTWQGIMAVLRAESRLAWLVTELQAKYGL